MGFVKVSNNEIFDADRKLRLKIQGRDYLRFDAGDRYMLLVREIGVETGAVYIPQVLYWILKDETEVHANLEEKQLVLDSLMEFKRLIDPRLSIEPY